MRSEATPAGFGRRAIRLLTVMFLLMAHIGAAAPPARAATFTVDTTVDAGDAAPGDGDCATDAGDCTLRAAIEEANAGGGSGHDIVFNIPTTDPGYSAGVFRIAPSAALPVLGRRTSLDGTTQPGYLSTPLITLDGRGAGEAHGLVIDGSGSRVRGLAIGGFAQAGVVILKNNVTVDLNFIGTDATGVSALANGIGVYVSGNNSAVSANTISGNAGHGIDINGGQGTRVRSNRIGVDRSGGPLGNGEAGINVRGDSGRVRIGGIVGASNTIAHNGGDGVVFGPGAGNEGSVLRNSIHSNGGLGIDLRAGAEPPSTVTPNDAGDGDGGPNSLLNFPVITSAVETTGNVALDFTLDADVGDWFRIDFFRNGAPDPSGHGEGQTLVASTWVMQSAAGPQPSSVGFSGSAGDVITATTSRCDFILCLDLDKTSEFSAQFVVSPSNNPPVLVPIGSQGGDELGLITFDADASDPDDDGYSFALNNQPPGATIDSSSGVFSWTPTEGQGPGTYDIDVIVTDDGLPAMSDSETVAITVGEVNVAPSLGPISDATIDERVNFGFTATATDPDLPANPLTYSLIDAPAGATIGSSTGVFSWTPSETQGPGVHAFTVVVSDGGVPGPGSSQVVTLTVLETNEAPFLAPIGGQSVVELSQLTFTAMATDGDIPTDTLTYSLANEPAGASIDPGTGVFTWTPSEVQGPRSYDIDVIVTDDGSPARTDTETITVVVDEDNTAPVLGAVGDRTVDEGSTLGFTATGSDGDVPPNGLVFSITGAPAGASIDPVTGEFLWTPSETQGPGAYDMTVWITDDGTPPLAHSETITVTVDEVNAAPTLEPIGNMNADEHVPLLFTAIATDPDLPANRLTYSLDGAPAGATIDPATGEFRWAPSEAEGPGFYAFDVVVSDGALETRETITVTVAEVNVAPLLAGIGDQGVDEQTTLSFTAAATDPDAPQNTLTYSLDGAPAGAAIGSRSGSFSWKPAEFQGPGSYTFDVVVTDSGTPALEDRETITVVVAEVNRAPTLIGPGDLTADEGEVVNIGVGAWDPDLPAQTLTWSAARLPNGLSIDPTTGGITGVLERPGNVPTAHNVVVRVVDGVGGLASASFVWTVVPTNIPPTASDDFFSVDERDSITVSAPGLLANDTDVEPGVLSVALLDPPSHGDVDVASNGSFTYTHMGGAVVDDSFSYLLIDAGGAVDTGVVSIHVHEVNNPPRVTLDVITTAEDSPVVFDPVGNDTDPDGDTLTLDGFGQPGAGVIQRSGDGSLTFTPAADFSGTTTATYTVRDGRGGMSSGTVQLVVTPVNDAPVGIADTYEFRNYLPGSLAVLSNDSDPDGDALEIRWIGGLEVGSVDVEDGVIIYTPEPEWSGTTTFTYTVADPHGAVDIVEVSITVRQETRRTAISLIADLEFGAASLVGLGPTRVEASSVSPDPVQSVSLMVNAFYQTMGAFRLPFVFLGLSLVVLVGLGGVTKVPLLLAGRGRTHWSVVLLDRESALQVFKRPDPTSERIYNFNPTTESVLSTGKVVTEADTTWMRVHTPRGDGWVDSFHLTEQVDIPEFQDDQRPPKLLRDFAEQIRSGGDVTSLISERGLVLALTGAPTRLSKGQFDDLFGDSRFRRLPTVGKTLQAQEEFRIAVAEPFLTAFDDTGEVTAHTAHSSSALIPAEMLNFRYLALGEGRAQPWLVFFEYEDGKPRIVGLGIDE